MISLEEYLIGEGVSINEDDGITATSTQVLEYLRNWEYCSVDLSGVTMSEKLVINGMEFENFNAQNCDFNGGLEIRDCKFTESLDFEVGYVQKNFKLENVEVQGNLDMPANLSELDENQVEVTNLHVVGRTIYHQP